MDKTPRLNAPLTPLVSLPDGRRSTRRTVTGRPLRIAIVGGDGRHGRRRWPAAVDIRVYGSQRERGAGELHRVRSAVRAGETDLVVVLARWVGHGTSSALLRECRRSGVELLVWARGLTGLSRRLESWSRAKRGGGR
jgi:hypothetical protein